MKLSALVVIVLRLQLEVPSSNPTRGELLHGARTVRARFNVFGIFTQLLPR